MELRKYDNSKWNKLQIVDTIGTGAMGEPMAGHILNKGYKLLVFNRTQSKTERLV